MRIGQVVKYRNYEELKHLTGKVLIIHGKKWITVAWSDKVNLREHIEDLLLESK